jgi:hypothetical protein
MSYKRTLQNLKKLPARVLFTLKAIPAGLRGELVVATAALSLVHIRADGSRDDRGVVSRKKVTQAFVKDIVNAMGSTASTYATFDEYQWHDSGIGVTDENNADTTMETSDGEARVNSGSRLNTGTTTGIFTSIGTISYTTTKAITEHGVFNASTGGTMLDRSKFTAVNVISGDSIQFTYVLTINPEA